MTIACATWPLPNFQTLRVPFSNFSTSLSQRNLAAMEDMWETLNWFQEPSGTAVPVSPGCDSSMESIDSIGAFDWLHSQLWCARHLCTGQDWDPVSLEQALPQLAPRFVPSQHARMTLILKTNMHVVTARKQMLPNALYQHWRLQHKPSNIPQHEHAWTCLTS